MGVFRPGIRNCRPLSAPPNLPQKIVFRVQTQKVRNTLISIHFMFVTENVGKCGNELRGKKKKPSQLSGLAPLLGWGWHISGGEEGSALTSPPSTSACGGRRATACFGLTRPTGATVHTRISPPTYPTHHPGFLYRAHPLTLDHRPPLMK